MMQLKALAGLQAQREALDSRRHGQADSFYQDGLKAFAQASNSEFRDRAALQQALEAWVQAVRHQRGNPEPCIALGYLFMILGDSRTAVMYLKTAERLAPDHPDPPAMLAHLAQPVRPAASAAAPAHATHPAPAFPDGPDEDDVLDGIRDWIVRLATWPPPQPAVGAGKALGRCRSELSEGLKLLTHQLNALDAEMDVAPLRAKLEPLERRCSEYGTALDLTMAFEKISAELQALEGTVRQAVAMDMELTSLEKLLDRCDWIADRLDEYSNQGHDVSALENLYGRVCEQIEALQDRLDS